MQNTRPTNYTFTRDGVPESVHMEKWCWEAHYNDDVVLYQFNGESGTFHQMKEIEQARMKFFRMINYETGKYVDIDWHPAYKLIHKYMRTRLDAYGPNDRIMTSYCFGYETRIAQITHKFIMVILPNDNIVITEDTNRIKLE